MRARTRLLVGASVAVTILEFCARSFWRLLPMERFALSLVLAGLAFALAWPIATKGRISWATALLVVWVAALVVYVGAVPVASAALVAAAAISVGIRVTRATSPLQLSVAATVGVAVIAATAGWVITFPIHTRLAWLAVLCALVAIGARDLAKAFSAAALEWRSAVEKAPTAAALCVALLGLVSTACWLPAMQMDDLSYHLGLPAQWLQHGRYAPDVAHQVWAYAPWAGDTLHAIVGVLAQREVPGAMNALWLVLGAGATWSLARQWTASTIERWAAVACYASFPPLVWMAAGMQTEMAGTTVTLALAALVSSRANGRGAAIAVLVGAAFALKLVHGISALPLLAYALARDGRHGGLRAATVSAAAFVFIAGSSYVQAWLNTGNPWFPLFNGVFRSPHLPLESYRDDRWFTGIPIDFPLQLIFDTDRYVEAWDGALGFAPLALAGAVVVALLHRRSRWLALAALACATIPLLGMQYVRYAYPGIVLLCVVLPWHLRAGLGARTFSALFASLCLLNLAYQANASWMHHTAAIKRTVRNPGDAREVLRHYVPERLLVEQVPNEPHELVLMTDPRRTAMAQLAGRGRTVSQHDPWLGNAAAAADLDVGGEAWTKLMCAERIRWVVLLPATASDGLQKSIARNGERVDRMGDAELWRFTADCVTP